MDVAAACGKRPAGPSVRPALPPPGSWAVGRAEGNRGLSMSRPHCRQVFDCGDGVGEVTALALVVAKLRTPHRLPAPPFPSESGDSADSVAAIQDACAPTRISTGSWSRCAQIMASKLPMNRSADASSARSLPPAHADEASALRCQVIRASSLRGKSGECIGRPGDNFLPASFWRPTRCAGRRATRRCPPAMTR